MLSMQPYHNSESPEAASNKWRCSSTVELRSPKGAVTWQGVTNETGTATFAIAFTDSNQDMEWLLCTPGTDDSLSIRLLTDTPILLTLNGPS